MRAPRHGKRGRALRGPRSRRSRAPLRPPRSCRPRKRLWHPPLERRRCKPCVRPPDRASLDAVCARSMDTCVSAARNRPVVLASPASLDAGRQSRSSTFAAPAPTAASHWRRAAASRRTARRSLAACPRIGGTFCRRASTWPCARSWGAIRGGATRTWIARGCASALCFSIYLFVARKRRRKIAPFGSSLKFSNPQPFAPLGSSPPRAPLVCSHR